MVIDDSGSRTIWQCGKPEVVYAGEQDIAVWL